MKPYFEDSYTVLYHGNCLDVLAQLPENSVQCCVTSPPYWGLRDYGVAGQLGQEPTPDAYVQTMVAVFREVKRVLHDSGTVWLNVGDSYAGSGKGQMGNGEHTATHGEIQHTNKGTLSGGLNTEIPDGLKPKDLCLIPWRLAIALQADGWWVRSVIVWAKKSCMPESVTDRPTNSWEPIFLLAKSAKYFYDTLAVAEPSIHAGGKVGGSLGVPGPNEKLISQNAHRGKPYLQIAATRNQRNVWHLGPEPFSDWTRNVRQVRVELDDADDGTKRTTSPDCPIHGARSVAASKVRDGGREGGQSPRKLGSGGSHAQGQSGDSDPSAKRLGPDSAPGNSDSHSLFDSETATLHSKETRKTEAPSVSSDSAAAELPRRTVSTGSSDVPLGPDDSDTRDSSGIDADTVRTDTCSCSYYKEVTESISHFATFPTEIPRRAILAGTSERGCCPECRQPWVREVEHSPMEIRISEKGMQKHEEGLRTSTSGTMVKPPESKTVGWRPGCDHGKDPVPCVVLDPFAGSGTTLQVAKHIGRIGWGIELSEEYCGLIVDRCRQSVLL